VIKPTRGRVVLFTPAKTDTVANDGTPLAAIIAHVHSDGIVNLTVFDAFGRVHARPSVELLQEGDQAPAGGAYAEWMPYQKGQAAKTEALEKTLELVVPQVSLASAALAPHQQRVLDEKGELDGRLSKLREFFATPTFEALDADERDRLTRQSQVMGEYSLILNERIGAFPA
jgi:hypothetical protein